MRESILKHDIFHAGEYIRILPPLCMSFRRALFILWWQYNISAVGNAIISATISCKVVLSLAVYCFVTKANVLIIKCQAPMQRATFFLRFFCTVPRSVVSNIKTHTKLQKGKKHNFAVLHINKTEVRIYAVSVWRQNWRGCHFAELARKCEKFMIYGITNSIQIKHISSPTYLQL